jgi:hypothetical protein
VPTLTFPSLAAIHPPEAIRKVLDCLGLPSRSPPIASAVPEMSLLFVSRKQHPLLTEVCENPVSCNVAWDHNLESGELNFGRGARSAARS